MRKREMIMHYIPKTQSVENSANDSINFYRKYIIDMINCINNVKSLELIYTLSLMHYSHE